MPQVSRKPTGFVLDQDARDELHRLISDEDLDSIANDVGVSSLTLCKALGGHPVSAMTVLNVQRFIDDADDADGDDDEDDDDGEDDEDQGEDDADDDDGDDDEDGDDDD